MSEVRSGVAIVWILCISLLIAHFVTVRHYLCQEDVPYSYVDVWEDATPVQWR